MTPDLDNVFACVALRSAKNREHHIVKLAFAIANRAELRLACRQFRHTFPRTKDGARHFDRMRPAHTQQSNGPFTEGR